MTITFLSFFIYYLYKRKFRLLLYSTTTLVSLFSLFVVMNLYWILPYVLSSFTTSNPIGPTYVLNLEIIDVLSRDNDFLNTLTLTADWMNFGINYEPSPPTSFLHSLWLFSIYLFPVLAIFSFVLWVKKIKYSLILFVFFVIGFVLALGTNIPFDYFSILFTTPILGKIAWVFRDPDKWSFLIAFSYSFFITLFSVFIFNLFSKRRSKNILVSSIYIVIIISSIAIFAYPVYNYTMEERYNSIKLPEDFDNLNNYLSTLDTQKVFFMPYSDTPPYWSLNHSVTGVYQPGIYQLESDLPSNQIFYPVQKNYYNYFTQLIQNNQTKEGISNFIYPFGTSYLIYHNDTISEDDLSFLNKVYNLNDLQHDKNIGFFDVFKLPKNQSSSIDIMNTNNNIGVVQGLDKLSLLNKVKSFSSTNSSVLFLDQNPSQNISSLNYFNNIILEPSFLDLVFPFLSNDYFVSPFEYTYHNDDTLFWSRVNAIDSLHGEFHPYLQPIGIDNWDLDYGKGIVITQASGAKLDIPIKIDKEGQYDLFIRYLENFRGGNIKIFLDDNLINEINTQSTDDDDKFVWKKIWSGNLTEGQHKLTIENANGFNAINTFAIVPPDQFKQSMSAIMDKSSGMNLIYLMDQADFDSFGNNTNSILVPLFNTTISNMTTTANKI
ncbi:MAG TPA: hypothetical protein VMS35_03225, partial [Nitrososphaeraceae archaeon]|nr:hypothetical protein [Nitrososphaeraceae archaeon]